MSEKSTSVAGRGLKGFAERAMAAAHTAKTVTSAAAAKTVAAANNIATAKAVAAMQAVAEAAAATKAATAKTGLEATTAADDTGAFSVSAGSAQSAESTASAESADSAWSADPAAPDERDVLIARLERDIEAERAKTAELEKAVKALEFQLDVLERSYGKQLTDARAAGEAATEKLTVIEAQLEETRLELRRVTAVRDRLHDMFAFDGRRIPPELRERQPGDEDTIARLLSAAPTFPEPAEASRAPSEVESGEPESGELLSPELVFDPNEDRDD